MLSIMLPFRLILMTDHCHMSWKPLTDLKKKINQHSYAKNIQVEALKQNFTNDLVTSLAELLYAVNCICLFWSNCLKATYF